MGKLYGESIGTLVEFMRVLSKAGLTEEMFHDIASSDELAKELVGFVSERSGKILRITVRKRGGKIVKKLSVLPQHYSFKVGTDAEACNLVLNGEGIPSCKTIFVFEDDCWHLQVDKDTLIVLDDNEHKLSWGTRGIFQEVEKEKCHRRILLETVAGGIVRVRLFHQLIEKGRIIFGDYEVDFNLGFSRIGDPDNC